MYISDSKKLAFVHIQKTGGSTVETILRQSVGDLRIVGAKHSYLKYTLHEVENWKSYYSFAFVRNPWDRMVSWYSMIEEAGRIKWWDIFKSKRNYRRYQYTRTLSVWKYFLKNTNSFDDFIRHASDKIPTKNGVISIGNNQLDYISDKENNLLVDFVGRFENFKVDMETVCSRLGIDSVSAGRPDRKTNRSVHKHYSHYYTDETRKIVGELFNRDIEYFGYKFNEK